MKASKEYWQLYNEQGQTIPNKGKDIVEVFEKAILHGASHVWIWRYNNSQIEVLLQKRASDKPTWPDFFDISAAGHIDDGESPLQAGIRETKEEIGIDIKPTELKLIGVQRMYFPLDNGWTENEFQWLYLLKVSSKTDYKLADGEVDFLVWKSLEKFKTEFSNPKSKYVPHSNSYYLAVVEAIEREYGF